MREAIIKELEMIENTENVRILLAVESGSRAWGFASPDSDYDVRFIYVRNKEEYMKLEKTRDVIEWKLDDVLDINGWDIKKALQLLYKSNPTIFEWCSSPIVYMEKDEFSIFRELLPKYFSVKKNLYHYLNMAQSNYREYLKNDMVRVKKYFYVLRPILSAKWIMDKRTAAPMFFDDLVRAELDERLVAEVNKLIEMKKLLPELGMAKRIQVLNDYIEDELVKIKVAADKEDSKLADWEELDDMFMRVVGV